MGVGGLVATMVLFVLRAEYPDWGRRVSRVLVRWAAYAFPEPERSVRREEWDAELAEVWVETGRACTGLTFASGIAARYGPRGSMRLAGHARQTGRRQGPRTCPPAARLERLPVGCFSQCNPFPRRCGRRRDLRLERDLHPRPRGTR